MAMNEAVKEKGRSRRQEARLHPVPLAEATASVAEEGVVLTAEQKHRRRARSIAIAVVLGGLAVLFYLVTIVKLGPHVLDRTL